MTNYNRDYRIIAYGAGTKAKLYLSDFIKNCKVDLLWDQSAIKGQKMFDVPVLKPDFEALSCEPEFVKKTTVVIIFIEDLKIRSEVVRKFNSIGYKNLYGYERILYFLSNGISIYSLVLDYRIIGFDQPEVVFDILPNDGQNSSIAYNLETKLRRELDENSKTDYRPIRMSHSGFYDSFAVYEKLREWYSLKRYSLDKAINILEKLVELAANKEAITGLYVDILLDKKDYKNAFSITEDAIAKEPSSLFLSTVLEKINDRCKHDVVEIDIPFPSYDLSERFCFSGVNFATCEGFNDYGAVLNPCFRGHQCAARPNGEFWTGEEWTEFRKSLFDGSFRYCQKDRCPNILGGWLPKKSDYPTSWVKKMEEGDFSEEPPLEELHLSYDNHCNLMCNSCRREIKNIDEGRAEFLNYQFDKQLRGILQRCKHLTLSGCGEASISPHGRWILNSLSSESYPELSIELRTNVFALSKNTWEKFGTGREVIKHITASVDGATKDTFEKLRYPAKWEVFTRNLRFIQSLRNSGEIEFFEFHVVAQTANIDELLSIVKMALDYDVDAVTFSRIVYWNNMPEEEYYELNPFNMGHPRHDDMMRELDRIDAFRRECLESLNRPFYVNIHGYPDLDESYKKIRIGKLKVR